MISSCSQSPVEILSTVIVTVVHTQISTVEVTVIIEKPITLTFTPTPENTSTITPTPTVRQASVINTVKVGGLTVSISPQPIAQSIVKGTNNHVFANVVLDASASSEDVKISQGTKIGYNLKEDKKRFTVTGSGIVVVPKGTKV